MDNWNGRFKSRTRFSKGLNRCKEGLRRPDQSILGNRESISILNSVTRHASCSSQVVLAGEWIPERIICMNHSDQLGFESKRRSDGAGAARPQILVLDDDKTLAWMLFELLRLMGYEATVFTSPQEALASIEGRRFDAIICDFHMPQMNGREFYRQVAARRPEQARHIVFLTGDMSDDGTLEFLESNSNPHLFKPFQMADLQNLLNHCLAHDFERIIANAA